MHLVHQILNYVSAHHVALLSLVGGGAGLSLILEVVLRKAKVDSKKVAFTLLHLLSLTSAAVAYVLSQSKYNVVPAWAALSMAAQFVHRFLLSPAMTKYVEPFLEYEAGLKSSPAAVAEAPAVEDGLVQ